MGTREVDPLADPEALRALLAEGRVVANLGSAYYQPRGVYDPGRRHRYENHLPRHLR